MKAPDFTVDQLRQLLDYDPATGVFSKGGKTKGFLVPPKNYMKVMVGSRQYLAHRVAWMYVHGNWPDGQIDHINGCKTDNRIANLRCVSARENMENIRAAKSYNKTSKMLGVTRQKAAGKPWVAQISVSGKNTYLGRFDTVEDAHSAYLQAKRRFHSGCTI